MEQVNLDLMDNSFYLRYLIGLLSTTPEDTLFRSEELQWAGVLRMKTFLQ